MSSKPKILLVAPTALDYQGNPIKQKKLHLPALTLPMLAAITPEDEADVTLVSETSEDIPFGEHWDLVGLTGMGSGLARAYEIADQFREKKVPVVIGGIAASLCEQEWTLKHADALVIGEAEEVWPEVITDFKANRLKPVYRMERTPDINTLPLPRYDMMNARKLGMWRPVQATRGCPFPCSFCSIQTFFGRRYRKRPVDQVVRDVREAKRSGSRYIVFIDDNIGVDWDYAAELWAALIPEKIIWMSQCSIQITDRPEMLKLAYRSGCRLLSIGVETTNQDSLMTVGKDFNHPSKYKEQIRRMRKFGIDISTEMIIGMDADKHATFNATYDFIVDNKIAVPRVHILTPVPGTQLYKEMEAENRLISKDIGKFSGGKVVFHPKHITAEALQDNYWKLYEKLYTPRNIFRRLSGSPMNMSPYMRLFLTGVNLHYRGHIKNRITPGIV
ncbi:radical SAM protein [Phaeodactylibacter xiamenensis]|uniref:radical SAM protein n=1 Tax=Phaeodactylibacter xiamenensis TaxID=1524460 RepID=UPI003CCBC39F